MKTFASSPNLAYGYPTPGPQRPTAQKVMDHVFFLSEEAWKNARENEQFDYVIIGSGFCALAFAERILSNYRTEQADKQRSRPHGTPDPAPRILILERGTFFLPEHFQNLPLPYFHTLGGLSETFPWTLSVETASQPKGSIQYQHGMVPFFGGRSIMWSAWCPRPTPAEMPGWPQATIDAAQRYFPTAEALLNVVPADKIDQNLSPEMRGLVAEQRPVYGVMQQELERMLAQAIEDKRIRTATRSMAAPLAIGTGERAGLDFAKFSTPAPLLELAAGQQLADNPLDVPAGCALKIACDCVVDRIYQQQDSSGQYLATALDTSRGVLNLGTAKLILAMGTIPPATLLLNSFPELARVGERFTAHFITAVVARVPRADYAFASQLQELELAAIYMAGVSPGSGKQYHVQLSVLSDQHPQQYAQRAARYMPDVVATASAAQLAGSENYLVFVCAVLGELDENNPHNHLRRNGQADPTTNVTLQVLANPTDHDTWDAMDKGTFQMLEALSPHGPNQVEYWHGTPDKGRWVKSPSPQPARDARPPRAQRRVGGLVHEGSLLWLGEEGQGVVGLDYRPHGIANVYVTGGSLWPTGGSWNPTLTMVALTQDLADQLYPGRPAEAAPTAVTAPLTTPATASVTA